jgi:hypothetical protein
VRPEPQQAGVDSQRLGERHRVEEDRVIGHMVRLPVAGHGQVTLAKGR